MKMGRIEKWLVKRPKHAERMVALAERLLGFADVQEGQSFLEAGSGSGAVCRHVARKYGLNVTGIDIDPDFLEWSRDRARGQANVRFQEGDVTDIPFPDDTFDIILSIGVMHHIPNWLDALEEIYRTLKPGGHFVYFDIFYRDWSAAVARLFKNRVGVTAMADLNSFVDRVGYTTVHSSLSQRPIFNVHEAVYRKGQGSRS